MSDWVVVSCVTGAYLILVLGVGLRARAGSATSTLEGYVAGGRGMGFAVLFFVIGAEAFSAFAFLGAPGWAYDRGAPALYILGYFALGILPWWAIGPRTARVGKRFGYLTQAELLGDRFASPVLAALVALVGVAVMVPYLTIQIVGAGFLFEATTGGHVPFWLGALVAFAIVAVYVFASGLRGIGWTNLVQGVLMAGVAWVVGLMVARAFHGGVGPMFAELAERAPEYLTLPGEDPPMSWGAYSSAIVVSLLGLTMWPHLFSKAYGAVSEDTIKRIVVVFPLYGLLLVPVLIVGFAGILIVDDLDQPDRILLELVGQAGLSPWLVGVLLAGALAAAMSTGANLAHTAASILVRDFLDRLGWAGSDDRARVGLTRAFVLVLCAVGYALALDTPASIIQLVLLAFGGLVQFSPVVWAAFFWPRASAAGALAGVVVGELVTLHFTFLAPLPLDVHAGVWGLAANVAALVAVSLLTRPPDEERVRGFLAAAATPLAELQEARAPSLSSAA